jgi:hypothetical protein
MDCDDDGVLEAARAIRPYLRDLVGPTKAGVLDRHIADLFTGLANGTTSAAQLRALLDQEEDTAWFLGRVLADKPRYWPPYQQSAHQRDMTRVAGDVSQIEADRYACPEGDYVWYRPDVGTRIRDCPDHHIPLARS